MVVAPFQVSRLQLIFCPRQISGRILGLVLAALGLQAVAIVFLGHFMRLEAPLDPLTLKSVLDGSLSARSYNAQWMQCGIGSPDDYVLTNGTDLYCVSPSQDRKIMILRGSVLLDEGGNALKYSSFSLSSNGKRAILATKVIFFPTSKMLMNARTGAKTLATFVRC